MPTFFGTPVPRHTPGEHQRAAAIVMSYFHPWTLRIDDADNHVKHASCLRGQDQTWQDALQLWLSGNVLCQEAKQYVGNFLSVHRMRPRDDDSDEGNSQDIVSDEELEISRASLKDALTTRVGGKDSEGATTNDAGPTHFENSVAAIEKNQEIWGSTVGNVDAQIPSFVEPKALDDIMAAAKKSQKTRTHASTGDTAKNGYRSHAAAIGRRYSTRRATLAGQKEKRTQRRRQTSG